MIRTIKSLEGNIASLELELECNEEEILDLNKEIKLLKQQNQALSILILLKVRNKLPREICSRLKINTSELWQWESWANALINKIK